LYPAADLFAKAASGDPEAIDRLPTPLNDMLRRWDIEGLFPSGDWLHDCSSAEDLPPWALFGQLPMSLFANGLSSRFGFKPPDLLSPLPPAPSFAPWRVKWLLSQSSTESSLTPLLWLDVNFSQLDLFKVADLRTNISVLANLDWPPIDFASSWLALLHQCVLVVDPDPDRVAFLRLFGVPAVLELYPSLDGQTHIGCTNSIIHFQRHLGLPDPRWLLAGPSDLLELSILGSSGVRSEQLWSSIIANSPQRFLWLPRVNMLVITCFADALAFQTWLMLLRLSSRKILTLEPLHHGLFGSYAKEACFLGPDLEATCLQSCAPLNITPQS